MKKPKASRFGLLGRGRQVQRRGLRATTFGWLCLP